jgi:hypothetical protein
VSDPTFEKLDLKNGDVVVCTAPEVGATSSDEFLQRLASLVSDYDVTVVLLEPGMSLETLDEDQMRQAGWVRA